MTLTMNEIYKVIESEGGKTPADKVKEIANEYPDTIAMRYKELGIWNETTYRDFWLKSKYVAICHETVCLSVALVATLRHH